MILAATLGVPDEGFCKGGRCPVIIVPNPEAPTAGHDVTLTATGRLGAGQDFFWEFRFTDPTSGPSDDNETVQTATNEVTHKFLQDGIWEVQLWVGDGLSRRPAGYLALTVQPSAVGSIQATFAKNLTLVETGDTVIFEAEAPPDDVAEYRWFVNGAELPAHCRQIQHAFSAAGTFSVRLEVDWAAGGTSSGTQSVAVANRASQALSAAFDVYEVVQVDPDPVTPNAWCETLREIDLAGEEIELGLKVWFDGARSTGTANFSWSFMDGTNDLGERVKHAFTGPGSFNATLRAYNASWSQNRMAARPLTVAVGMGTLSFMAMPGERFPLVHNDVFDGRLWTITGTGSLVTADISNPNAPSPGFRLLSSGGFGDAVSMAVCGGRLFVARGGSIVDIYALDPNVLRRVDEIDGLSDNSAGISSLVCWGDYLVASGDGASVVDVWHVSGGAKDFVGAMAINDRVQALVPKPTEILAVVTQANSILTFSQDIDGTMQALGTPVALPAYARFPVLMDGNELWIPTLDDQKRIRLNVSNPRFQPSGPRTFGFEVKGSEEGVAERVGSGSRFYYVGYLQHSVVKFDATDPRDVYLMDGANNLPYPASGHRYTWVDSSGVRHESMIVSQSGGGFSIIRP